jgi:hypothetical protein
MGKITFITIIAIDRHSSHSMTRTFSTTFKGVENEIMLKSMIEEWEKEIPYHKYELITQDFIEDYSEEILNVLGELEVTFQ